MPAIHDRMSSGIPGDVSRKADSIIEPVMAAEVIPFGSPVQLDASGKLIGLKDGAKPVYGFLVRAYPTQSISQAGDGLGASGTSSPNSAADVLRAGYMTVRLSAAEGAQPAKGTPVKAVFADIGAFEVGDIAVSQGVPITGCTFMGEADASGNVEIAFNI
jgi:uncharacterized protein YcsI (UPF0317 family)